MIKKTISLICTLSLFFCLISCKQAKPATAPPKTEAKTSIQWIVYDPESLMSQEWQEYSLLKDISKKIDIYPEITVVTDSIDIAVTKLLISGEYPDLVTIPLLNSNLLKFTASMPAVSYTPEDELYKALPQSISEYHGKEQLNYIPGGFNQNFSDKLAADEGVYLYTGSKQTSKASFESFSDLISYMNKHRELTDSPCTDLLLFGKRGFETLEHLFGITPQEKFYSLSLSNDYRYKGLLDLFADFGKCGVNNCRLESFDSSRLPLVYIGESAYIIKWNSEAGKCLYTQISICGNSEGFLSAASPYGKYATIVTDGKNCQAAESLLLNLLTIETSEKLMLGEENTHWLRDKSTNTYIIPDVIADKMNFGDTVLWNQYGISVFPYLSSCGAYYPKLSASSVEKRDLLQQYLSLCIDPTSRQGADLQRTAAAYEEQYLFALSQNNTQ